MRFAPLSCIIFAAILLTAPALSAPNVVTSIKPVHSLVSAVMQGVGEPHLIVRGGATPHTFSLRPSDADALSGADLVFWVGPDMENFLDGTIENLAPNARSIELSELPELTLLPLRENANFEHHDHDHDEDAHEDHEHGDEHAHDDDHEHEHDDDHGHAHEGADMHIWLDPANAAIIVEAAAEALASLDAENADQYRANADATLNRLTELTRQIEADLAPFQDTPFVTFHDAYQYFEARFGVSAAGAITLNPESQPGARRIAEIRETISRLDAVCIFTEPQFAPSLVAVVAEGTNARTGTLDPIGADLEDGSDLYFNLLSRMADNMRTCFDR